MAERSTEVDQRVVLITGAGRGIGAASARAFAAAGYAVVAADICEPIPALGYELASRAELDAVVADCEAVGAASFAVVADVRDQSQLDAAAAAAVDRFGGIDVTLAAAGVIAGGPVAWELSDEVWAANVDVNLTGVWRTAKATIPAMMARPAPRSGRFVAVASAAGMGGHPAIAAYCAAKHGVVGLVRSLAADLGASGVTANAVCPGSTDTAILRASGEVYRLASVENFAAHHPIGRILEPEEVARAVLWLAAPEAGGVTGAMFAVDGGMTI